METASIPLLTENNWSTWKVEARVLLIHFGSWEFIKPTVKETTTEQVTPVSGKSTTEDKESTTVEGLTYKEQLDLSLRKQRAYTLLYRNISDSLKPLIASTTDGAEAWQTLEKYFEPKTRARIVQLLDEFFSVRYKVGEDIALFLCRVKEAAARLAEAGHVVENLYQGFTMIRYLPPEFQATVQQIYRWPDTDFIPSKIEAELILEANRLKLVTQDLRVVQDNLDNDVSVLHVGKEKQHTGKQKFKFSSKFVKSNSNDKKIGPCFKCKRYGHLKVNCKHKPTPHRSPISKLIEVENDCVVGNNLIESIDNTWWVLDTGATTHFCNNKNLFSEIKPVHNIKMALAVGEKENSVQGIGSITFYVNVGGTQKEITLENVLYNPNLRRNLLSGSSLEKEGANFVGSQGKIWVFDKDWNKLFYAKRKNDLYFFKPSKYKMQNAESNYTTKSNKDVLWHKRFGHINQNYLMAASTNESVRGLPKIGKLESDCISCKLGKSKSISFKEMGAVRSKQPLELLHMDVCGPMPIESEGGNRFFLSIIDDYSKRAAVYPIKNKSDVFATFTRFQKRAERSLNKKIISIRTDKGLEFCNKEFKAMFNEQGINHERTNTYSPQQNGVAERYNQTSLNGVRTLLNDSGIPAKFWAEALLCFTYVWNRICHKSNKTPFELYSGRKPSVKHLRIFGCLAYVHIPKQKRKKLDLRAKLGIMMGYALQTKGYRIWVPEDNKIIETINVRFNENVRAVDKIQNLKSETNQIILPMPEYNPLDDDEDNNPQIPEQKVTLIKSTDSDKKIPLSNYQWTRKAVLRKDGSRYDIYYGIDGTKLNLRSNNDAERYCNSNNIEYKKSFFDFSGKNIFTGRVIDMEDKSDEIEEANFTCVKIPNSYKEAMASDDSANWKHAMDSEMQVMHERQVWELVTPPDNVTILGNRWVYTIKENNKGEIVKYRARLVAQGCGQHFGETYEDVFSPVVSFTAIRLFFIIYVSLFHWQHLHLDVNNAYLYADIDEIIYMKQPVGYKFESNKVCKLKKALYGLKQSGRLWYYELDDTLLQLKFKKLNWCNCIYSYENNIILMFYVDDIILFGKTQNDLDHVIQILNKYFDLKILGRTKKLLGIEFEEKEGKLLLHQKLYIEKIVKTFQNFRIPITSVPIPKGLVLSKQNSPQSEIEVTEMEQFPYRNLIGCLSFIANKTRPDIMYAVNLLSQFQSNPGIKHWDSLLKLLGYVNSTREYKLDLSNVKELNINCYSDSDYAANRDDRVSIGAYVIFVDKAIFSWRTFKHKCISLSTMESEYITLAESAKELIWVKNMLSNDSLKLNIAEYNLLCDNIAAIQFSKSPVENHRSKHIDIKYHFVRNLIMNKTLMLSHIKSKENYADYLTKPFTRNDLMKFCSYIFDMLNDTLQ